MKLRLCIVTIFLNVCTIQYTLSHSLIFVHLGPDLPNYFFDSFKQARLFNKECPIYLIAHKQAIVKKQAIIDSQNNLRVIVAESLVQTQEHKNFSVQSTLFEKYKNSFWVYASERFFYLHEFIDQYDQQDVFHIEYDNMLYCDLDKLLPICKKHYNGIAAVFDDDNRCIPSFMYFKDKNSIGKLVSYMSDEANKGLNDMEIIAKFMQFSNLSIIDHLPIITKSYIEQFGLKSQLGRTPSVPLNYAKNEDEFNSIFDGAALGQYIGGTIVENLGPGFINETCLFNPAFLKYEWKVDELGRKIPFAIMGNKHYRINNLHIHSKKLWKFFS